MLSLALRCLGGRRREDVPSNDQTVYFWRETNMKCYSLTPLVFLSRNHLDSEGLHKQHSGLLNLRFPIVYGCALGSQTRHQALFLSFFLDSVPQAMNIKQDTGPGIVLFKAMGGTYNLIHQYIDPFSLQENRIGQMMNVRK